MTSRLEVRPHPIRLCEWQIVTADGHVATGPWFRRADAQRFIDQLKPDEIDAVVACAEEGRWIP